MATLKYGDRGAEVKKLQRLLQQRGFFTAYVGGNFLERTEAAVRAFQAANRRPDGKPLEVDGKVGKNTWWALRNPPPTSAPSGDDYLKYGDRGDAVVELQRLLARQKVFSANATGNFLTITRNAVVYFQQTHLGPDGAFLEPTGIVGPDTWWALRNATGPSQRSGLHASIPEGLTPVRERHLEIVLGEHAKDVKEEPPGSNWSADIARYGGRPGDPWCCWFWSWANREAAGRYWLGAKIGACKTAWATASKKGMAHDVDSGYVPVPGDAFVQLWRDSNGRLKGTGHIGYVLRVEVAKGRPVSFNTVEGNSGNRVKLGLRHIGTKETRDMVGYINPFPGSEQPSGWETGVVKGDRTGKLGTR